MTQNFVLEDFLKPKILQCCVVPIEVEFDHDRIKKSEKICAKFFTLLCDRLFDNHWSFP